MSNPLPPLDAIPLPGEAKSDSQNEKKKPKLRHIQDTNQPSSILVTKVVTTKPSSKDPASKLKAIVEKKKNLPTVSNTTNSCKSPVNINMNSGSSVANASHPKNQPVPASQTIVDELFKDFLAAKQKEEQTNVKRKDPDIANSMEEMSKLLDEEINLINSNQTKVVSEKKGRWDIDVKKGELKKKGRWDNEHKKTVDHPGEKDISQNETKESMEGGESVDDNNIGENGKKALVKLGLKLEISKESISWINSGEVMDQKKKVVLEEGEVLSSSTDENSEESDESDKDEEFMETGSLSNSDREKSKSKKKKKHKHKHKKKKKHKSAKSDRKSKDKSSKDDKESKKESKDGKKKEKDEKKDRKKEDHKSKSADKRRRTRSRSKSPKKRKTHSRSRSRERHRFSEWDARNYRRSRSRSRSQERRDRDERYREQDERQRHRDRDRGSDGDRAKERERHGTRSKEAERDLRVKIDKSKLRKIAIANVLAAVKAGEQGSDMDLATLKAGGKSVEELTDFCKKISEKERDYSDSDSDSDYGHHPDVEDLEGPFINHPFKLRDPSTLPNIIMNIRNSKQLPVLTPQAKATQSATLRLQFPVSSGSQHRIKENEWVPVEKTTTPPAPPIPAVTTAEATTPPVEVTPVVTAPATNTAAAATTTAAEAAAAIATGGSTAVVPPEDKVFPDPPPMPIDIGAIVSERLSLVRKLSENPYDVQALSSLYKSQEKSSQWAQSKFLPGHFTGSTGVQTLSQQELAGPDKRNQAWLKKVFQHVHHLDHVGFGTDFAMNVRCF